MRSNTSLDLSRDFTQGCGGSFENWHCLIPLISGQSEGEIFLPPRPNKAEVLLSPELSPTLSAARLAPRPARAQYAFPFSGKIFSK
jgi:hypothetical protein